MDACPAPMEAVFDPNPTLSEDTFTFGPSKAFGSLSSHEEPTIGSDLRRTGSEVKVLGIVRRQCPSHAQLRGSEEFGEGRLQPCIARGLRVGVGDTSRHWRRCAVRKANRVTRLAMPGVDSPGYAGGSFAVGSCPGPEQPLWRPPPRYRGQTPDMKHSRAQSCRS